MDDGFIFIALVYFNRFLFIKNKPRFISSEGFSNLEKNALICYQGVGALFVCIQTFWVGCYSPLLNIMVCQKVITICRGLSHPTRSLSK
jgi:hypothetical protein